MLFIAKIILNSHGLGPLFYQNEIVNYKSDMTMLIYARSRLIYSKNSVFQTIEFETYFKVDLCFKMILSIQHQKLLE